jgi:putative hydrolase of the HAD superfamily
MAKIKVISFDLDGTITDICFVDSVWLEGIPRLYSLKKRISFEDAKKTVKREYDKVGRERLEWYNLHHWIKKFGLNVSPRELLTSFEHRIRIFPEVPTVLDELKHRGFRLVIVTNARREFVDVELGKVGIENCFERVFSSTSDFGLVKKTIDLYQRVCSMLEIFPQEMIHVGDDRNFDFNVPRRLGILAFHLDRTGKHKGNFVIHSLEELNEKLARFL